MNGTIDRLAGVVACLLSMVAANRALAVERFVPDDFPSIQAAINASSSGDVITVRPGTYNERLNVGGRSIVLRGQLGPNATIIDPQGAGGVVVYTDDNASNGWVLEGFTIRNGFDSGLYASGVAMTVRNCKFLNNQASRGGGAHVRAGANVTFESCEFVQNRANSGLFQGGAVYVESSTAAFEAVVFSANRAERYYGGVPGGAYFQRGGAICSFGSNVSLDGCISADNVVFGNFENGGWCQNAWREFYSQGGFAFVSGGQLSMRNHLATGDRAYMRCIATVDLCSDHTYVADARGGFVHCESGAVLVVEDSDLTGCRTESIGQGGCCYYNDVYPRGYGGVLFIAGSSATIRASEVVDGRVTRTWLGGAGGPQASNAGFIYHESGALALIDTVVRNATAPDFGGAIRTFSGSGLTIDGCRFENCVSGNVGGAIAASVATGLEVSDTDFVGCRSDAASGGAIWLTGGVRSFTNCTFTNNVAQGGGDHRGGAVYAEGGAQIAFTDCDFTGNEARSSGDHGDRWTWGGACAMFGVSPRYTRCTFTNNAAISSGNWGGWRRAHGGATAEYDGNAVFTDCTFVGNRAECVGNGARYARGGSVHLWNSDTNFVRTSIRDGRALPLDVEARGGGVWMENVSRPGFISCTIADCDGNEGAGVFVASSEPYFVGTSFRGNAASSQGGAMLVDGGSTPYVLECAFEQNSANSGGAIRSTGAGTSVPFVVNSTFCGNVVDTIAGSILGGDGNVIAAECSTDCNGNGVSDTDEIASGAADVDGNGRLDACQEDCNANGVPDAFEMSQNAVADCNGNGTPDPCDVTSGISPDADANGVPDECELERVRLVPFEYASIGAAIGAAQDGDEVVVAPGAYYEKLNFGGRRISMRSVGGAGVTFIDGNGQNGTLLAINGGQDASTAVDGFTFWYAQGGHALYVQNASPTIRDCRFLFNSVGDGAALRIEHPSDAQVLDCLVESNVANTGGGVWTNASPAFARTTFRSNVANGSGGAVRAVERGARFVECEFIGNRAQGGGDHRGGAVSAAGTNNLSFVGCLFEDNLATSNGDHADRTAVGGACSFIDCIASGGNPPAAFTDCVFDGNLARATGNHGGTRYAYGGAIHDQNSDLRIMRCDFVGNRAETSSNAGRRSVSGAIAVYASNPMIAECGFMQNAAEAGGGEAFGGALHFYAASNGTVRDCAFDGNAAWRGGAIQLIENSQPNVRFTVFTSNSASDRGGAVHANASPGFFFQCEFRHQVSPSGSAIFGEGATGPNVFGSLFCSNVGADLAGTWSGDQNSISEICNDCNGNGVDDADDVASGASEDCDVNGVPDACDADADGDGAIDACDSCAGDPAKSVPGQCGCGVPDADADSDGVADCNDSCPADPLKTAPGDCGCGVAETDGDGDGTPDCDDLCPADPAKTTPDSCGCGVVDADSDSDGSPDCIDGCPSDPAKTWPGACGCGVSDADGDADGAPDCVDACPSDPLKTSPGVCGCGVSDADSDVDGIPDCLDNCPSNSNAGQQDCDGDGTGDACTPPADCNGNGIHDRCEIASGAADVDGDGTLDDCESDCDASGLPDDFEIATGISTDCDGNGLPDACDLAAGSLDSDGDGLLDECETDCDGNGLLDAVEIASGMAADCDSNGILDSCQDRSTRETASAAPWGGVAPLQLARTGLPPATGPVRIKVEVRGDLDAVNEFAILRLNGVALATLFGTTGQNCPANAQVVTHVLSAAQWNAAVPNGTATLRLEAPVTVGAAECASSFARITLSYQNPTSDCDLDGTSNLCEIAAGTQIDCDGDRVPDACALATGTVADCNGNGQPDACDLAAGVPDCDGDGVIDACAVASGAAPDCNANGIPDACDLVEAGADCDGDGVIDACAIASGGVPDCDGNGIPDECDLASGAADCNGNGVIDSCDVASGASQDVDVNGVPDECKADCNGNGLPDSYELEGGLAPDCDGNGVVDSCDLASGAADCNGNGVPDSCDLASGTSADVNGDGRPDDCEADCNANGIPDAFEIANGSASDCNANGLPDSCDIAAGASDCNGNGVIDSCDVAGGEADENWNQIPDACEYARGDFDLDGTVGAIDLAILLSLWGTPDPPIGDLDGDGVVSANDLALLLNAWG